MARPASLAYRHYQKAIAQWPKDTLRPTTQLQDAIRTRVEKELAEGTTSAQGSKEMAQVNAMYALLGNRFSAKYKLNGEIMKPQSHPTYFQDLERELREAPTRTWFARKLTRIMGILRF